MAASRSRVRLTLGAAAMLAVVVSACSVEEALPHPNCQAGGSVFIAAQSVPSADFAPCFNPFPTGWEVTSVKIDQDGTLIDLDSDRAGSHAAKLRYAETCERGEAVHIPTDHGGVAAFEYIERLEPGFRAERYFVFSGGCVWWEFDFDNDAPAALSIELGNSLDLRTRVSLNEMMSESFIDEEL